MYDWILVADIYRLEKALQDADTRSDKERLADLLQIKRFRLQKRSRPLEQAKA